MKPKEIVNPPSGPKKTLLGKPKEAKSRERNGARKEEGPGIPQGAGPELSVIGAGDVAVSGSGERTECSAACRDISDFIFACWCLCSETISSLGHIGSKIKSLSSSAT